MDKNQRWAKSVEKLKGQAMDKKFKTAFSAIVVGMGVVEIFAIANVLFLGAGLEQNARTITRIVIATILLLVLSGINMCLCSVTAKVLSMAVVEPVCELQGAIRKVKNGEFDIEITYDGQDEIGELAEDLKETCSKIHTIITDSGYLLGEMAEGNFNVSTKVKDSYVGDFNNLILSIEKVSEQLDSTLCQIREASELVRVGSEQLASSAQELAEGATEQAGAVAELTTNIENVTNISKESADNAVKAATSAKATAEDAEKSREKINQLTEAMERITETSQEIENIISAIENIAAETNMLSLNASIEAARAGEAGRGFAVVADQIGKLAADSAQSAVTTRELISKSLEEIEKGNKIVEYTLDSIGTVLTNMDEFAGMASSAAEASKVQVEMLKQVEVKIDQISSVVQSNSAAAEETSAVSQELSTQSVGLEQMVEKFVLREA